MKIKLTRTRNHNGRSADFWIEFERGFTAADKARLAEADAAEARAEAEQLRKAMHWVAEVATLTEARAIAAVATR